MNNSVAIATAIATLVAALSPFALRYVELTGLPMTTVSVLVSLLIAVVALMSTGQLTPAAVALDTGGLWTIQQLVYQILSRAAPKTVVGARAAS